MTKKRIDEGPIKMEPTASLKPADVQQELERGWPDTTEAYLPVEERHPDKS